MLYPKIEDCVKEVGCKYTLATIVFKRAKDLAMKSPAEFVDSQTKEITYSLREVLESKVRPNIGS